MSLHSKRFSMSSKNKTITTTTKNIQNISKGSIVIKEHSHDKRKKFLISKKNKIQFISLTENT